jgi:hypothetical protein
MNNPICNKCNDYGWVCENHPNQEAFECKHCKGAGMPCECHELNHAIKENDSNWTVDELIFSTIKATTCGEYEFTDEWIESASQLLRQQEQKIAELEKDLFMLQRHYDQLCVRELTDEEITEVLIEEDIYVKLKDGGFVASQEDADLHKLAKSILKKASEK